MPDDHDFTIEAERLNDDGCFRLVARIGDGIVDVDQVYVAKSVSRTRYSNRLCEKLPALQHCREAIEDRLLQIAAEPVGAPEPGDENSADRLLAGMPEAIREEANEVLRSENLVERILDDLGGMGIAGERENAMALYMIGTSRLLAKPNSGILMGASASGKSYIIEKVARLFPLETKVLATQITPNALFYLEPGSLKNRFVVAGERSRASSDEFAEATRALREMLSSGNLSKLLTVKAAGRMVTQRIEQEGPIAFVESTSLSKVFDEDANRCILLQTDEQSKQTRLILETLAAGYATGNSTSSVEHIVQRHHAVQRMIRPRPISVPYAERLAKRLQSDQVETRRAFPTLMSMIQSFALLHQFQREEDADGNLIAAPLDYHYSRRLLVKPFCRVLGIGLSDAALRFYERLIAWAEEMSEFTTTDARKREKSSRSSVHQWMIELADHGCLELLAEHHGNKPARWKLTSQRPGEVQINSVLPPAEDIVHV